MRLIRGTRGRDLLNVMLHVLGTQARFRHGFEAAEVKGHYLVLVWAEFVSLHAPAGPEQRATLENFMGLLMQKTANVALANRQVTGNPPS